MDVQDVLFEIIDVLDANSVDYAVMGGLAVRVYALPRPTQDVDLTVAIHPDESTRLVQIVESAGFEVPEAYRGGWTDQVAKMPLIKVERYVDAHKIDVDVFLTKNAFQRSLMTRRQAATIEDRTVWLVSPEDLVLLKLAAGRPRDKVDVQDLLFTLGDLDRAYLDEWARTMGLQKALVRAWEEFER